MKKQSLLDLVEMAIVLSGLMKPRKEDCTLMKNSMKTFRITRSQEKSSLILESADRLKLRLNTKT